MRHAGGFFELEDQMVSWIPEEQKDSPDRIDALVHAQAFLHNRERGRSQVVAPGAGSLPIASAY